ncbi:bifunctional pyr operon transcriptional regulator/uracil phosphoribosyltransferase PyrR [bacterium]|nr:bifunctional pyr operon transcriptional regulator/uracil phosphoribosyltransferase PyrR [bacterium]
MKVKAELMSAEAITRTLLRLTHEILEKNHGIENLVIIGIRNRGDILARRIIQAIAEIEGREVPLGILDITLYRDDFQRFSETAVVQETEIPIDITDKKIILVDDVLYTGRTIRAALDALTDFGRPSLIQLAVLVDRGHRELPIKADYVGKNVPTAPGEEIAVQLFETDKEEGVVLLQPE